MGWTMIALGILCLSVGAGLLYQPKSEPNEIISGNQKKWLARYKDSSVSNVAIFSGSYDVTDKHDLVVYHAKTGEVITRIPANSVSFKASVHVPLGYECSIVRRDGEFETSGRWRDGNRIEVPSE